MDFLSGYYFTGDFPSITRKRCLYVLYAKKAHKIISFRNNFMSLFAIPYDVLSFRKRRLSQFEAMAKDFFVRQGKMLEVVAALCLEHFDAA